MKKKAYISPAVNIHTVNVKDGIMLSLSGNGIANGGSTPSSGWNSDTKGSGDWNIWGGGSAAPSQGSYWQ